MNPSRTIKVELTPDEFVVACLMLCRIDRDDPKYPHAESAFNKLFKARHGTEPGKGVAA